jgi:hypothetical protein
MKKTSTHPQTRSGKAKQPEVAWDKRPLRIAAMQVATPPSESLEVLKRWHGAKFNVEQLLHVIGDSYYSFYDKTRHEKRLTNYIREAHRRGMKIIAYINVMNPPMFTREPREAFDTWLQHRAGLPPGAKSVQVCVNSPWRDAAFKAIEGLCACGADGIFMDGPHFAPDACYCNTCQTLFQKTYGHAISRDPADAEAWARFQEFRKDSITAFVRDARAVVKRAAPHAILYLNHFVFGPTAADGQSTKDLLPYMDWLGSEGGFTFYGFPQRGLLWKVGSTAKMLEAIAPDKPRVIFINGANCPWNYNIHTPAETELMLASTAAHGANHWYCFVVGLEDFDSPGGKAAMKFNRRLAALDDYYAQTRPVADVALFWSQISVDTDGDSAPESDINVTGDALPQHHHGSDIKLINEPTQTWEGLPTAKREPYHSFQSAYGLLWRSQIPFDIVHDQFFSLDKLRRYRVLVLPNVPSLSRESAETIRQYVREGGKLIAFFETSLSDETGARLNDFQLADVFGVKFTGFMKDFCHFAKFDVRLKQPFAKGFFRSVTPAPRYGLVCEATTAKAVATYYAPFRDYYMPLPALDMPAIYHNKFGQGECYYFNNKFCEQHFHYGFSEYRLLLKNMVETLAPPLLKVEANSEAVEVALRRQDSPPRLLVHLVNYTASHIRPIGQIVPLHDVRFAVKTETAPRKITALYSQCKLKSVWKKGYAHVTLPKLDAYEVLSLEF